MDVITLALAKKYTEETVKGGGALKGAACTIKTIETVPEGNKVTFEWTLSDGSKKTEFIIVKDGIDGINGIDGKDGDKGEQGEKGVGIESITKKATVGLIDTYLIVFNDGTETTFDVVNGANITKTSQLENDSNFITNATIGLINYYLKDEVYSKSKIDEFLRNIGAGLSVRIVPTLPTEEISGTTIYLINTSGSNFNQYMWIDGDWASLGSTSVDLSSYYNKTQIDTMLLGYITASTLLSQLMQYAKLSDLSKVAKSNDYNDLDNLPEIPDVSGIKPYTSSLQDSENTAPTSKALFDAVQTINSEVEKKADSDDIPTDYTKQSDFDDYKGEVQDKFDEVNVNLGVLEGKRGTIPMDATSITGDILQFALDHAETWAEKIYATSAGVTNVPTFSTISDWSYSKCKISKRTSQIWVELIGWSTGTYAINVYDSGKWSGWKELATMDKVASKESGTYQKGTVITTPSSLVGNVIVVWVMYRNNIGQYALYEHFGGNSVLIGGSDMSSYVDFEYASGNWKITTKVADVSVKYIR